jgi:hypothetical protein
LRSTIASLPATSRKAFAQITSRVVATVDKPMPLGGMTSDRTGSVMILTLKRA